MNTRAAARITLAAFPAAWLLMHAAHNAAIALLGIAVVAGGFILGLIACRAAIREGDTHARNLSIGGIVINGAYLALVLYLVFFMVPRIRQLGEELKQQAEAAQKQPRQKLPPASPAPAP